jgi:hypothetical protein
MATTTPNYGWTVPTSTDLVKDGATAIETLGDAIDASMNTALGTKKAGMVLLNTTSFSAVASQSINDVFSTTYTNYKVIFNLSLSATTFIGTRMRVSGTDNSSSQYVYTGPALTSGNTVENAYSNGLTTSFLEMVRVSVDTSGGVFDFQDPFETKNTLVTGLSIWNRSSTLINSMSYFGVLKNSTSYTGFTFFPNSGTMTGSVSVYGYNK